MWDAVHRHWSSRELAVPAWRAARVYRVAQRIVTGSSTVKSGSSQFNAGALAAPPVGEVGLQSFSTVCTAAEPWLRTLQASPSTPLADVRQIDRTPAVTQVHAESGSRRQGTLHGHRE